MSTSKSAPPPDEIEDTDPGCCPNCGSGMVDYPTTSNPVDHKEGVAYRGVCQDCGCRFKEIYGLEFVGTEIINVPKRHRKKLISWKEEHTGM